MEINIGERFDKLVVLSELPHINYMKRVRVKCDCGQIKDVYLRYLLIGSTKSCGCIRGETHNLASHPLYKVWNDMKNRCYNQNRKSYKDYGGRGILICEDWKNSFQQFYNWCISSGWEKGLEINRINNDGNYEPSNCNFVTSQQNSRNRRNNVVLEYKGESKVLAEWSDIYDMELRTLWSRIFVLKWDLEKAFNTPIRKQIKNQ